MTSKPRKPWRVILSGPDEITTTDHASETEARTVARAALDNGEGHMGKVFEWKNRRWWLTETFRGEARP